MYLSSTNKRRTRDWRKMSAHKNFDFKYFKSWCWYILFKPPSNPFCLIKSYTLSQFHSNKESFYQRNRKENLCNILRNSVPYIMTRITMNRNLKHSVYSEYSFVLLNNLWIDDKHFGEEVWFSTVYNTKWCCFAKF